MNRDEPVAGLTSSRPLAETVARLDTIEPRMNAVRLGMPTGDGRWDICADVVGNRNYLRAWQDAVAEQLADMYSAPADQIAITAAACVLDWYAYAPGFLVGAMFHTARRVPHVEPDVVAFRRDTAEHWISGTALLCDRFWCLPDDPAADHSDASVVPDHAALAAVARQQVGEHATRYLAQYDPGVRLPRRALTGVFFDSLDSGPWIADPLTPEASCLDSSLMLLPGEVGHFRDRSRLYLLRDHLGRDHISRRRVACCESYRIAPESCFDCPRTSDDRRIDLATDFAD